MLHHQVSGGAEEFGNRLTTLLKTVGLKEVRFSVAFARWDGIGLLSEALEDFLSAGGRFESVYGAGNGVTTSDALHYGLLLELRFPGKTYSGFIEDKYANTIYHPKIYEFRFVDRVVVIVGSPNLTGGGLARNGEAAIEISLQVGESMEKQISTFWKWSKGEATKVTLAEIRRLAKLPGAGSEKSDEVGGTKSGKPFLKVKAKLAPRPLFAKVLDLPKSEAKEKSQLLADMDTITERPVHLFLQIFERETGGQKGKSGSAVQLPVATLGAYFGLGSGADKEVTFRFPNDEIKARVIHNTNHTHQVRLKPIFTVKRPAIIHFERIGKDIYRAKFIPPSAYVSTLNTKCPEQRRQGARRWGIFS
jgi:HKD family nuclease